MYLVRWNLTSVTQPLHLLSHAIEVALALNSANPGWRPSIERADGEPLSADDLKQVREAGL